MSTDDPLGDIEVEDEDSWGKKAAEAVPVLGDGIAAYNKYDEATEEGDLGTSDLRDIAVDGVGFVSSCKDAVSDFATDPIGWLVGEGLDFLISICQPLQDLIHLASGDGPALSTASDTFTNIAEGVKQFGDQFAEEARSALAEWQGSAAETAGEKFGEFGKGIKAVAGEAGNIAQLLKISSMIMTVIEEFIKALLTEFITWLIMIWVPALAAAIPTAGASTAAAGTATGVRAAQTTSRATKMFNWLRTLLDKIKGLITKLKNLIARQGNGFRQAMDTKRMRASLAGLEVDSARAEGRRAGLGTRLNNADAGMVGERVTDGFVRSMAEAGGEYLKEQVEVPGLAGHANDYKSYHDAGDVGAEQSQATTSEQLDF